jgi:hypothetical protein
MLLFLVRSNVCAGVSFGDRSLTLCYSDGESAKFGTVSEEFDEFEYAFLPASSNVSFWSLFYDAFLIC